MFVGSQCLATDMEHQKEKMINESKKIVEYINSMSLVNLDDQQVYSLMMIKEIARGILHNKIDKVSERGSKLEFMFNGLQFVDSMC